MSAATLAARVKAAREGAQLSMRGIVGVDHSQLSRIESGKVTDPGIATMTAIAKATGKTVDELMGAPASAVRMIALRDLFDDPDNSRAAPASDAENDGLIASIRERGLILPLAVRQVTHEKSREKVWAVIDGHRRLMALRAVHGPKSKIAVPCRVMQADDTDTMLLQLSANLLRSDMNHWDLARAVASLVDKKVSTKTIAAAVNMGLRWVQEQASVGKHLQNHAAVELANGRLSISQAVAIAAERDADAQYFLTNRAISERLNEDDIRALTADRKATAQASKDAEQADIEDFLPLTDRQIEKQAPKPVGGWKTWRNTYGYFKWRVLKFGGEDSFIVETDVQWRRKGCVISGWGTVGRDPKPTAGEALAVAAVGCWSEYEHFAVPKDMDTMTVSLIPWISKGLRNAGADDELRHRVCEKLHRRIAERLTPVASAKTKQTSKKTSKKTESALAEPPPIDRTKPPEWALPMVDAPFMYHDGANAWLCKGWLHMIKIVEALGEDEPHDVIEQLYDRGNWQSNEHGEPFDFGSSVVRLRDAPA